MWGHAALLTLLVTAAGGAPQLQEDPVYPEEQPIYPTDAQMISTPETLVVREGVNVTLPCQWESEHASEMVVLWKKQPSMILFTANLKMVDDDRIRLGPDHALTVAGVTADDNGTYVCTVAVSPDPLEVQHTLNVQWPARLHPLGTDHFQIREGEAFGLTCGADGNPEPNVTWTKRPVADAEGPYIDNGQLVATTNMPEEEEEEMAFLPDGPSRRVTLTLDPVEPRHTGTYTCTAQNGIGQPDRLTATLEVLHAPHMALGENVARTAHGRDVQLNCTVFANPLPEVSWQRNGHDLPVSPRYETIVTSRDFALRIRDVKDEDLGNYTCRAKNELGVNEHHITLTGLPSPVTVHLARPQKVEGGQQSSTLSWRFTSFSTVEVTEVTLQPLEPAGSKQVTRVPTVTTLSEAKSGQYRLSPLAENTLYLLRVRARNQYGWTPTAERVFRITDGEITVTQAPPQLAESKRSGAEDASPLRLTPILLIAILSCFF